MHGNNSSPRTTHPEGIPVLRAIPAVVMAVLSLVSGSQAAPYTLTVTANHGSVAATPDKVAYDEGETVELVPRPDTGYCFTSWGGDAQGRRLVLNLTMDGNKTITADFGDWQPPIGIPTPDFGIFETHRMYEGQTYDFGSSPESYKDAGSGPYTHYVDNTDPLATDTSNPYGTAAKPRVTIPIDLPEGSVVEIHGGPYAYTIEGTELSESRLPFKASGTALKPVFFRGTDLDQGPIVAGDLSGAIVMEGTYIIVENINFRDAILVWPRGFDGDVTHHIAIRCSGIQGEEVTGLGIGIGWPHGSCDSRPYYCDPTLATDVVIYNNTIHDIGHVDWNEYWGETSDPQDSYGIYIHHNAYETWVVDNHVYNIDGDCIHLNAWHINDDTQFPPTLSYIGRNVMHHARENILDSKVAYDTIVSQNAMYDVRAAPGSDGTCDVIQTEHETTRYPYQDRAWHLFNEIYDCDVGIRIQYSANVHLIGNVFHDIISTYPLQDDPYSSGSAIMGWTTQDVTICSNVIYNTDLGILNAGNRPYSELHMANNIICNLTNHFFEQFGVQPYQVYIGSGNDAPERSTARNDMYWQNGDPLGIRWGSSVYDSVPAFQAATGQGQGSIEADPTFVGAAGGDFRVQPSSLAIDAGTSAGVVQDVLDRFQQLYGIDIGKDIEGEPRPLGGEWDIGAYECRGASRVYRFWSPANSRHFYTISEAEKDHVINTYASNLWTYEAVAYRAFADDGDDGVLPVYRFWSPAHSAHFYTISEAEKDSVIGTYASNVWTFEGPAFYAYPEGSQPNGTSPVYRFWSNSLGSHFYTISEAEKDSVIADYPETWTYEGIAWYVYEP